MRPAYSGVVDSLPYGGCTMSRRGQCRCGTVLEFAPGPEGYKTRCPGCGSVVRLRADRHALADRSHRHKRSNALTARAPISSDSPTPQPFAFDDANAGDLPVVEMVPLSELQALNQTTSWRRWWVLLTVLAVIAGAVVVAILMLRD